VGISGNVAIIGVGCTKFGELFDSDINKMIFDAVEEALGDANIDREEIEAGWYGNCFPTSTGVGMSGSSMGDPVALEGIPITRVENQCCTGMDAFRNACLGIASGEYKIAIAVGAEKMRDVKPQESLNSTMVDSFHPYNMKGFSSPGLFAMYATRLFEDIGLTKEDLAQIAVKNHGNATMNPKAHLKNKVTLSQVINAPMVSSPLGTIDCCPITDGAAAVIVTSKELAERMGKDYVLVQGIGMTNSFWIDHYAREGRTFNEIEVTKSAAQSAYAQAGIENPLEEIDIAEVHDCFTITEVLNMCDLGFCTLDDVKSRIWDGTFEKSGKLPVNVSGGLNCCGHPIGATGIRMIYFLTNQLLNRSGEMQVIGVEKGLAHNLGGPGSLCTVTILEKGRVI
jgi:acetyl-CoA C-acetyltransferase